MPNLKKINLLGHLNQRHDTPDDAVIRFIEMVSDRLVQTESSPVVNLLVKIISRAGQSFKTGLPELKQSPVSEFFEFLKSLRSELNPEQPFDEKFDALTGQINETVQYLVTGIESLTDESIIVELKKFAGIETGVVSRHTGDQHKQPLSQKSQNGRQQLEMPQGMLQQLFEPNAAESAIQQPPISLEEEEEDGGIVSGPTPYQAPQEISAIEEADQFPSIPVTGSGKTDLEFGFNLADLFETVASPSLTGSVQPADIISDMETDHEFSLDESDLVSEVIEPESSLTEDLIETTEDELSLDDIGSDGLITAEESGIEMVDAAGEDEIQTVIEDISGELSEIDESEEILSETVAEATEEPLVISEEEIQAELPEIVPAEDVQEENVIVSEEESFEESLSSQHEFDVTDLTSDEPEPSVLTDITEEASIQEEIDKLVQEDDLAEISEDLIPVSETEPELASVSEEPETVMESEDSTTGDSELIILDSEPEGNLHWMVQQVLAWWNTNLSAEQNFEIIQAGMQELGRAANPLAAFRDVSALPAYVDFVDFLEMLDSNPNFDRDVVRGEIGQIASRTFQLFNEILLQQTRPDLGELSDELSLDEEPEKPKEDVVLDDGEEPIISESVVEEGENLLVDQEGPTEEDLIPEPDVVESATDDILNLSLSDDSIADHVLHAPEETTLEFTPTEPVYFQVIQDLYADIKKLNSIGSNNVYINQFVDFSRSLKDPVELLREHSNVEIVKEFLEFIDELHSRYDGGQKNAYHDLAEHRMQIADRLYDMLQEHPEIIGEEQPEKEEFITESPLHLVSDSEQLVDESMDLVDQLPESMIGGTPLPDETQPVDTTEAVQDLLSIEEDTTEVSVTQLEEPLADEPVFDEPEEELIVVPEKLTAEDSEPAIADEPAEIGGIESEESLEIPDEITEEATVPEAESIAEEELAIADETGDLVPEAALTDSDDRMEMPEISDLSDSGELAEIPEEFNEAELPIDDLAELSDLAEIPADIPDVISDEETASESSVELLEIPDELAEVPDELAVIEEKPEPVAAASVPKREKKELNEIQQVFLLEAEENIQKISDDLLVLEKDLGNISIIDGILRSAHTLKGSAAMMKFSNMSRLGHKMEDVFQILRDDKMSADRNLIDIMLKGTDLQTMMLGTLREEGHDEVPGLDETIFKLEQYLKMLEAKQEGKEFVPDKYEPKAEEPKPAAVSEKPATEAIQADQGKAPVQQQGGQQKGIVSEQTLRINITTLNSLINLAAELLISRNRMNNQLGFMESILLKLQKEKIQLNAILKKVQNFAGKTDMGAGSAPDGFVSMDEPGILQDFAETEFDRFSEIDIILRDMRSNLSNFEDLSSEIRVFGDAFRQSILSVSSIANELNIEIMSMRMVPVKHMFIRFQRSIRDIGREEEKDVDLKVEGEDTRLDKTVMEEVIEPIMHCVRNAVSHGIELPDVRTKRGKSATGLITLRAYQDGNQVVLEVEDDGNGIDAAKLKVSAVNKRIVSPERAEQMTDSEAMELMFVPGFSTAEKVTSLSGRGVGMDVVKNVVNKFKGNISVKSTLGKGSCFTIRLPLTLAINQSLLIQVANKTYAFPLNTVEETVELHMENIQRIGDQELISVRDETIPLIHLANVLGLDEDPSQMRPKYPVVILSEADQKIAIRVDRLIGKEEIVVKNLGSHLKNVMGVTGATVLGDGSVILILDVAYLFRFWQGGSQPMISSVRSELHRLPVGGGMMDSDEEDIQAPVTPEPARTRTRGKIRVLCADDSVSIRKYVESLLRREEFEVVTAPDGAEAFDIAERNKFDLIMTDLEMPKMHGYELISAIRSRPNLVNIPIVILTARSGEKHRRRGLELGANAFLNKPFDVDELLNTIYSLIPR